MNDISGIVEFPVPPVVKTVQLACPPAEAFARFTRDIHRWWPTRTHSLFGEACTRVAFEPRVGGRLFECGPGSEERLWGTVVVWDEPHRLAFTWHVGRGPETAQRVELTFAAQAGGTRVRLVHSGWERLGGEAEGRRDEYDGGWKLVFERGYARFAAPPARPAPRCVVFHHPGPAWRHGTPAAEQPGLQRHVEHYRALLDDGRLAQGGPFLDAGGGGMMIAQPGVAPDELAAFAARDPCVASGLLTASVRTWLVGMDAQA